MINNDDFQNGFLKFLNFLNFRIENFERIMYTASIVLLIFGISPKIGACLLWIPDPVIGGIFAVMTALPAAVGIASLQFVNMNKSRNLFVLGFSVFMGIVIPGRDLRTYFIKHLGDIGDGCWRRKKFATILRCCHKSRHQHHILAYYDDGHRLDCHQHADTCHQNFFF